MDEPWALSLRALQALAEPLGFALVGVARAEATSHGPFLREWLGRGLHGEMGYLAQHVAERVDPTVLLPGARSVVSVADRYARSRPTAGGSNDAPAGRVARYAWGDDYHKVMKKRLFRLADALRDRFEGEAYKVTVDTAPVLEREHATRAGLGWIGKHTLAIHPTLGSYLLLGEIVTTLAIETSAEAGYPRPLRVGTDHCGSCTRCIDACPTRCIAPEGYHMDASRCISYLTLEHRSLIDASLHEAMGEWVAGCDVCQEVCPHNRETEAHDAASGTDLHPAYEPRNTIAAGLNLLELLGWSADDRQRTFQGSALKRMKLEMIKRNALIAAGNVLRQRDVPSLRQRIEALAADEQEHPLVRETAKQVLRESSRTGDSRN